MNVHKSMNTPGAVVPPAIRRSQQQRAQYGNSSGGGATSPAWSLVRTNTFVYGTGLTLAGLGLHFYYVRELAASMVLFSVLFLSLSLAMLSVFFVWYAGKQVASWAHHESRNPEAFPVVALVVEGQPLILPPHK